ncbi:MAG: 30S ribosomal protein S1 [Deltaproteobacteria bacterium]|nr:30S ribosomal protein S1 [Deltaproteobacteria bacterium]
MNELDNKGVSEFEALLEKSMKEPHAGELVKGTVVKITSDSVIVDVGYRAEGIVPIAEFTGADGKVEVKEGQEVTVLILRWDDDRGYIILSKGKADQLHVWDDLILVHDNKTPVDGKIDKKVNGGFHVSVMGVTAFLPSSQVDLKPVKSPDELVGKSFKFRVIKYNRKKNNLIISRRVILEEERDALRGVTLSKIEEGKAVEGVVKNITDYGAFVDLGGIDGLVHLSDMSWGKVTHPSQVVKVGDAVKVKILKYDAETKKISLGMKQLTSDPWLSVADRYKPQARIKGRVVNLTDYGAFVEIEPGLEGLVHISEMSWTKLRHPSQKVKPGDMVDAMILDVDPVNKRISLGLKQVEANPWDSIEERYPKGTKIKGTVKNITDFGVFIGVEEGIDGLVHVSDMSWKKVKHPSELFKRGQEVEAVVVNVDKAAQRFSLSTRLTENDPWAGVAGRFSPGNIVEGRVSSTADFGAFIEIESGVEGLIHVSELNRSKQKGSGIKAGDKVEVEILNVNPDDRKIGLSLRRVIEGEGA